MRTCNALALMLLGFRVTLGTAAHAEDFEMQQCVPVQERALLRRVTARDGTGFWASGNNRSGADLCIWMGSHAWAFWGLRDSELGLLGRYVGPDQCGNDFHWERRGEAAVRRDDCAADEKVSAALGSMGEWLAKLAGDPPGPSLIGIRILAAAGQPAALVFPLAVRDPRATKPIRTLACVNLVFGPAKLSYGVLFTPACDAPILRADQGHRLLEQIPGSASRWLAAGAADGAFGFGLVLPEPANSPASAYGGISVAPT